MSSVREQLIRDMGKETLHKPHQRIDSHPRYDYEFGDRGFWCSECRLKCVVTNDNGEVGHKKTCDHYDG